MKVGYLDCFSGISGDMCLGALVDVGVPVEHIESALADLPIAGFRLSVEGVTRAGIAATKATVEIDRNEPQPRRALQDVLDVLERGSLSAPVRQRAAGIFRNLAAAEAQVHGTTPEQVHFHDVGAVDAICDVVGTVAALDKLGLHELRFSTVALGGGTVASIHGQLPVPAPATALLLEGLPVRGGPVDFELATPTGAAILKTLGKPSALWPEMHIERLGYGAGDRDIEGFPNVLRLAVGTVGEEARTEADHVWLLEANLDDMTGEEVGFCLERLLAGGALDAYASPIHMKKGRPGIRLSVLCDGERLSTMEGLMWRDSSTFGIRRSLWQRSKLPRTLRQVETPWGRVNVKLGYLGEEAVRCEPEYEDCRRIAEREGLPLRQVYEAARRALRDDLAQGQG